MEQVAEAGIVAQRVDRGSEHLGQRGGPDQLASAGGR